MVPVAGEIAQGGLQGGQLASICAPRMQQHARRRKTRPHRPKRALPDRHSHGATNRSCCSAAPWVQDFLWQFSMQTFWLRPSNFLVTSSESGLWRPHLKHDIVVELLPRTGEPKADPAVLALYRSPSLEIFVLVSESRALMSCRSREAAQGGGDRENFKSMTESGCLTSTAGRAQSVHDHPAQQHAVRTTVAEGRAAHEIANVTALRRPCLGFKTEARRRAGRCALACRPH